MKNFNKNHMIVNSKLKMQYVKLNNAGFTLVELLTSVIVLIAIGLIMVGILSQSLRGANKTDTIGNIRQNGDYVLNQMSKDISYTLSFDGKNTGLSTDDAEYITSCPFSLSPTPVPVSTQYSFISVESTSNRITKYNCSGTTSATAVLSANGTPLIDANSISLQNCSLSCIQSKVTDIPIIKVSFSLGPKSPSSLVENSSPPIIFETSVTMKNYQR